MAIDLRGIQTASLLRRVSELKAERERGPSIADFARTAAIGVNDVVAGIGSGLSVLGLEETGKAIRGFGQDNAEQLASTLTPGGRQALEGPILQSKTPIASTALKLTQSAPTIAAAAVPGALGVRALGTLGVAGEVASLAPKVIGGFARPSKLATTIGFSASEGLASGASNAAQTRQEIETQQIEELSQNPIFQKHLARVDPSLDDESRDRLAREATARETESQVLVGTAITTGGISALAGGGVFSLLARPTRGRAAEALTGAVKELVTEAPQSALEQIQQNVATAKPATKGALQAAIEGGILGAVAGGAIGGFEGGVTPEEIPARLPGAAPAPVAGTINVPPGGFTPEEGFPTITPEAIPTEQPPVSPVVVSRRAQVIPRPAPVPFVRTEPETDILNDFLTEQANKVKRSKEERVVINELRKSVKDTQIFPPLGEIAAIFPEVDEAGLAATLRARGILFPEIAPDIAIPTGTPIVPVASFQADPLEAVGLTPAVGEFPAIEKPPIPTGFPLIDETVPAPATAPVITSNKIPKSFRGKTLEEAQALLETSTLNPVTISRVEDHINTVLRPATVAFNAEVRAPQPTEVLTDAAIGRERIESGLPEHQGIDQIREAAKASRRNRTQQVARRETAPAQIEQQSVKADVLSASVPLPPTTAAPEIQVVQEAIAATPVVAPITPKRVRKRRITTGRRAVTAVMSETNEASIAAGTPEFVKEQHVDDYRALYGEALAAGVAADKATASLQANYSAIDGFDIEEIKADTAAVLRGELLLEEQIDQTLSRRRRGRPTKEEKTQREMQLKIHTELGTIATDTVPLADANLEMAAQQIVVNPQLLQEVRRLSTEPDATEQMGIVMKRVNELLAGTPPTPIATSRPGAVGPTYLSDQEEIQTWQQLLAEFRVLGVSSEEAQVILVNNYDSFGGFNFDVIRAELQGAESGLAAREEAQAAITEAAEGADAEAMSPAEELHNELDPIIESWDNPPFGGVNIHEDISSVPRDLQDELYAQDDGQRAKGIFDPVTGTVHLIASHMATPQEAQFVLFHEVYGHFGLRGILGANLNKVMNDIYRIHPSIRQRANAKQREFNLIREVAVEEVLADLAGRGVRFPGLARVLAAMQIGLRKLRLNVVADWLEQRSAAEVLQLLAQAKSFVTDGRAPHIYTPTVGAQLYSFGGFGAKLANVNALNGAVEFEMAGFSPEQIRDVTGWHRGIDGEWRFEIDDFESKMAPDWREATMVGEAYENGPLFANYPELASVTLKVKPLKKGRSGSYDAGTNTLTLNLRLTDEKARSAITHELQHAIQVAEGFAVGGSRHDPALIKIAEQELGLWKIREELLPELREVHEYVRVRAKEGVGLAEAQVEWTKANLERATRIGKLQAMQKGLEDLVTIKAGEVYERLAGEIEARDVQWRLLMSAEERKSRFPGREEILEGPPIVIQGGRIKSGIQQPQLPSDAPAPGAPTGRGLFSRQGDAGVDAVADELGAFYDHSAPVQRAFDKLSSFGSLSSASRAVRFALDKTVKSPFRLARSGVSKGYTNLFDNVLRPVSQMTAYLNAHIQQPLAQTWARGFGLTKVPADYEAAARALFAHNDLELPENEFRGRPEYQALTERGRELYHQVRETMKRGLEAEFTAKAARIREAIDDPKVSNEVIKELYDSTQRRIDSGFIPNRRFGKFAIGIYHKANMKTGANGQNYFTGSPMQWYTFESSGEAKAAAERIRGLFGGSEIVMDIDEVGNGEPLTVERSSNDRYSATSYWDFLTQAKQVGLNLTQDERSRLATLMIRSESLQQNRIQRRKDIPGYSKDLLRVLGEFTHSAAFTTAHNLTSDRQLAAMNKNFHLNEVERTELISLQERFKDFANLSETQIYDQITKDPNISTRLDALNAYRRMRLFEAAGGQYWSQDGADSGFYRDRANEHIKFLREPRASWADKFRTLASLQFLGGSIASASVNLSSLPLASAPYLAQFGGVRTYSKLTQRFSDFVGSPVLRDAARFIAATSPEDRTGQAARDWQSLQHLGTDMIDALRRAHDEGIISETFTNELFGFSKGDLQAHSTVIRKAMDAWMFPFRQAERANRFTTFMAAYDIGKTYEQLSGNKLYDFAREAVDQTQGVHGPINRLPWARSPIGHVLFTFKAYPLMLVELIASMPPKSRTIALVSLVLLSGLKGLPYAEDAEDIVNSVAQRVFGSPFNLERALTSTINQASEALIGVDLAKLLLNGGIDALTPAAVAGRVGLGNLIPGTGIALSGEDFFNRTLADIIGPAGSEAQNIASALQGDFSKLLPGVIRHGQRALEGAEFGRITDAKGQTLINNVTPIESFLESLGFTSSRLNDAYNLQRDRFQQEAFVNEVKQEILNKVREGYAHNDQGVIQDAFAEVQAWNKQHVEWPIIINRSTIRSALQLAGLPLNERIARLTPRAWRSTL